MRVRVASRLPDRSEDSISPSGPAGTRSPVSSPAMWLTSPLREVRAGRALALALLGNTALVVVLRALFGLSLRTSDDAEMMAAVSGYDGGEPRPELLFSNVIVGLILRVAYGAAPEVPWYGLHLYGLQAVALATLTVATMVVLAGRPRILAIAVVGSIAALAPGFILQVQFTIVAFLLAMTGPVLLIALRRHSRSIPVAAGAAGLFMAMGLLVRLQAFALTTAVAALLLFIHALVRRDRDLRAPIALGVAVASLATVLISVELAWWPGQVGTQRPLPYVTAQLSTGSDETEGSGTSSSRASTTSRLTANDRELMRQWLAFPEMLDGGTRASSFAPTTTAEGPRVALDASSRSAAVLDPIRTALMGLAGPLTDDPARTLTRFRRAISTQWWLPALAIVFVVAASTRRSRIGALAFLLGWSVLAIGISGTRLPDRVALPLLLLLVLGTALVVSADERDPMPARRFLSLAMIALLGVGAVDQTRTVSDRLGEVAWRTERAERFFVELEELGIEADETVILWLVDTWWIMDPLGWDQPARYRDRTIQLAGWQYRLPYRSDQRERLLAGDWIAAVADRDDVLLVASPERVELLRTLLRERRGLLCSEPSVVGQVRDGREIVVRRFIGTPCYGAPVPG